MSSKRFADTSKTVVISINASWNIVNFRKGLVAGLQAAGYRVVALAPTDSYSPRLAELGIEHVPIDMDNQGVSPARDFGLILRYHKALRRIRPTAFLGYTVKPNVYGSLAAHALGIPVINNVSGLGTAFIRQGLLTRIVSGLYRVALRRSSKVFFQNPEDRDLFVSANIVRTGHRPGSIFRGWNGAQPGPIPLSADCAPAVGQGDPRICGGRPLGPREASRRPFPDPRLSGRQESNGSQPQRCRSMDGREAH
jgi:hypothetical protein